MNASFTHPQRGAALIVTLMLVVVIAILLTGFVTSARFERATASSHSNGAQAALFADMGLDVATARIATATAPDRFWSSGPGRIATLSTASGSSSGPHVVELSSGLPADPAHAANLNRKSLTDGRGALLNQPTTPLLLQWIYVRRDGTQEAGSTLPAYNQNNPIIGRYAFWADDESARLNWNTAGTRISSSRSLAHPGRIDLTALPDMTTGEVTQIESFRINQRLFNTASEALFVDQEPITQLVLEDGFSFTHHNHAPETNAFGEPRLLLTTQASVADGMDFFDITTSPTTDPALLSNLDHTKVSNLFRRIYLLLSRSDWPYMDSSSFVAKYGPQQAAQIALDLIDYVRAADSPSIIVEPLRGIFNATAGTFTIDLNSQDLLANGRKPYITQMAVKVSPATGANWRYDYAVEIHLPQWLAGTGSIDLTTLQVYLFRADNSSATRDITAARISGGNTTLEPGGYRTLLISEVIEGIPPNPMPLRSAIIQKATGARLDIAPLTADTIQYQFEEPPPATALVARSVSVNDPLINKRKENWTLGVANFNRAPGTPSTSSTLGGTPAGTPPQDTDATGSIVNGVRHPAPGSGVQSPGEIGFLHTGGKRIPETPWRTLRLQTGNTGLPDWLLLDAFAAPLTASSPREKAALWPYSQAKGGRVNLNALLHPFAPSEAAARRDLPLLALLQNASTGSGTLSATEATTLAGNLLLQTQAPSGNLHQPTDEGFDDFYLYQGQIAEILGIADAGEASEAIIRELTPLLTTQSNVFTVYSVGQDLRQQSNGNITVRGERRLLSMIERVNTNRLRIVYQKEVAP